MYKLLNLLLITASVFTVHFWPLSLALASHALLYIFRSYKWRGNNNNKDGNIAHNVYVK